VKGVGSALAIFVAGFSALASAQDKTLIALSKARLARTSGSAVACRDILAQTSRWALLGSEKAKRNRCHRTCVVTIE
jgi:hypothetical protein